MSIAFDYPLPEEINRNVTAALAEDVGAGDLTASLVPGERLVKATVICREPGVLCGTAWFDECVRRCDPTATITWHGADGDRIAANQLLCEIEGNGRALLTAERSALNFLQLLSAVASKVRIYADAIAGTRAQVVDTRKTLPGLRIAQKYAVRAGGVESGDGVVEVAVLALQQLQLDAQHLVALHRGRCVHRSPGAGLSLALQKPFRVCLSGSRPASLLPGPRALPCQTVSLTESR